MAFRKSATTAHGFLANDAYHRVENITLESKQKIRFIVRAYKNSDALASFQDAMFDCDYSLDGENPYKQAYTFVKSLPQYNGAEDC